MPEEEVRNASAVHEGTSGSVHESRASDLIDAVQKRTEACEKLVDETVDGLRSYDSFAQGIRDLGCSLDEAKDYFDAVRQRIEIREAKSKAPAIPTREATPEGLSGEDLEAFHRERSDTISDLAREQERAHNQAIEAAAWAALRSKLDHIPSANDHVQSPSQAIDLHKPSETSSIPRSLLDVAPHLAQLQSQVSADPHIAKTWELRQEYGKERIVDSLIDLGQLQRVKDPISRAMWKLVIMDQYVDFEKLYATLDKAYDHNDEPKDFMAGFSLVKKDHAVARRPILSESDWSRTFDAWMAAVIVFYPHHETELSSYRGHILDFFRSLPGAASVAIQFDRDARDRYARKPFRMDDYNELHVPLLSQLLSASASASGSNLKRSIPYQGQGRKRSSTI
ncbi:hypothetical protein C0993_012649, partial [Termitomyces sp. T159_Od127]